MKNKIETLDELLSFKFVYYEEDKENGGISINVYGNILNKNYSFNASYILKDKNMYYNGDYEEIIESLKNNDNKKVKVTLKIKENEIKDFKIDLESLSAIYNDDRFKQLELIGYGQVDINKDSDYNLSNKKIVLKSKSSVIITCNVLFIVLFILCIITFFICCFNNFMSACVMALFIPIFICILNYVNRKIIIDNSMITVVNLFNKRKEIGNISEIASFAYNNGDVMVFNKKKNLLFYYLVPLLKAREDNLFFYNYLKKYHKNVLYVSGRKEYILLYGVVFWLLLFFLTLEQTNDILSIFIFLSTTFVLLLLGINEVLKRFIINDNKTIIYKNLLHNKKINIKDLTKVLNESTGRFNIKRKITGYIGNQKVFKITLFPYETEYLVAILKSNNIKYIKK